MMVKTFVKVFSFKFTALHIVSGLNTFRELQPKRITTSNAAFRSAIICGCISIILHIHTQKSKLFFAKNFTKKKKKKNEMLQIYIYVCVYVPET